MVIKLVLKDSNIFFLVVRLDFLISSSEVIRPSGLDDIIVAHSRETLKNNLGVSVVSIYDDQTLQGVGHHSNIVGV